MKNMKSSSILIFLSRMVPKVPLKAGARHKDCGSADGGKMSEVLLKHQTGREERLSSFCRAGGKNWDVEKK